MAMKPQTRRSTITPRRESPSKRGYDKRWQRLRATHVAEHPLCEVCQAFGQTTPVAEVDHKTPHKLEFDLLYDAGNLWSLCDRHHASKTRMEETMTRAEQLVMRTMTPSELVAKLWPPLNVTTTYYGPHKKSTFCFGFDAGL